MEAMFPGLSESCVGYLLKLAHGESLRTAKKLYNVAAEFAAAQGPRGKASTVRAPGLGRCNTICHPLQGSRSKTCATNACQQLEIPNFILTSARAWAGWQFFLLFSPLRLANFCRYCIIDAVSVWRRRRQPNHSDGRRAECPATAPRPGDTDGGPGGL